MVRVRPRVFCARGYERGCRLTGCLHPRVEFQTRWLRCRCEFGIQLVSAGLYIFHPRVMCLLPSIPEVVQFIYTLQKKSTRLPYAKVSKASLFMKLLYRCVWVGRGSEMFFGLCKKVFLLNTMPKNCLISRWVFFNRHHGPTIINGKPFRWGRSTSPLPPLPNGKEVKLVCP